MRCSICGQEGHNARTCPQRDKEAPRNYALWFKFDNLTRKEATDLKADMIRRKERLAPNSRATFVSGLVHELPDKIRKVLGLPGGEDGSKKK